MKMNNLSISLWFEKYFYLPFRARYLFTVGLLLMTSLLSTCLYILPFPIRLYSISVYGVLLCGMILSTTQFVSNSVMFSIGTVLYHRKHPPEPSCDLDALKVAKAMNVVYNNPIYITDCPKVDSPYTNLISELITIPRSWLTEYTPDQIMAAIAHELAHLKRKRAFTVELSIAAAISVLFGTFLLFRLPPIISQIGEVAFMMWVLIIVLRRNELLADKMAAKLGFSEHLISLFEELLRKRGTDEGSETHPPLGARIRELRNFLRRGNDRTVEVQ